MIENLLSVVSLITLLFYLYGVLVTVQNRQLPNECKMTYMFEYPQFVKVALPDDVAGQYPKYNLFAYSEGRFTENARNMMFNGAPVIFVPGNAGSYKQGRSLASVGLQKAIDLKWSRHLDYFVVDFNEELLGVFGGFLEEQSDFVAQAVQAVLQLYRRLPNPPKSVVVITHSMGCKIIQSALINPNISNAVNTVIMLAAPVDRPVVNVDVYFEAFYRKIDQFWQANRAEVNEPTNTTNTCCHLGYDVKGVAAKSTKIANKNLKLKDLLLITIGGGDQDLLVQSGLTSSKFSDVHAMSTSIPEVWLSTDHLSSVWCLQQIIVINRFLFSIIAPTKGRDSALGLSFLSDKQTKLEIAQSFFAPRSLRDARNEVILVNDPEQMGDWIEDSRRVFSVEFPNGHDKTRYQMIRLTDSSLAKFLHVEVVNVFTTEWIFGCAAIENFKHSRYCSKAILIKEFVERIPSQDKTERSVVTLDLHKLKKANPQWTHVLLRTVKTVRKVKLNVDIHGEERNLQVQMPKWYKYSWFDIVEETVSGSSALHLQVSGMDESFQSVELVLETKRCSKAQLHSVAKVCVPWTNGFERFHQFVGSNPRPLFIHTPSSKPLGYNTTENPITVDLYLDPDCTYTIRARSSFGMTLARIVQQFSHWLPAHIAAILLLAIKHQLTISPKDEPFKCGTLRSGLLNCSSFFIITASRVFIKIVLWTKFLPLPDTYEHSLMISAIIHGAALAVLLLVSTILSLAIRLGGRIAFQAASFFPCAPTGSTSTIWRAVVKFPAWVSIVIVSMMLTSCGGIALIFACCIYFVLLIKMQMQTLTPKPSEPNKSESSANADEEVPLLIGDKDEQEDQQAEDGGESETKESVTPNTESEALADDDDSDDTNAPSTAELDNALGLTDEDKLNDAELNRLIKETMEMRKNKKSPTAESEEAKKRQEYDATAENVNFVNYNMSLFTYLVGLTLLNVPSVIACFKNFAYSSTLDMDPSFIPAVASLVALSVIWQVQSPRDIAGYTTMGSFCYMLAVICVLYCQDSVYRLNAIVATTFICFAVHQLVTPNAIRKVLGGRPTDTKTLTPEQIEKAMAEIMAMEKELLGETNAEEGTDNDSALPPAQPNTE